MDDTSIMRIHCNACGQETRHVLRASHSTRREDSSYLEEAGVTFEEYHVFEIFECLGCEEMVARETWQHEAHGESPPRFYPPRISRRPRLWQNALPPRVREVLDEVYRALQTDSRRLAVIGARTVVDTLMLDKIGDVGTFPQKLKALEDGGYIGTKNREFLAAALDAGSAAAHRGLAPEPSHLTHVMDIVENLVEAVYALERAAATLKLATPPRQ